MAKIRLTIIRFIRRHLEIILLLREEVSILRVLEAYKDKLSTHIVKRLTKDRHQLKTNKQLLYNKSRKMNINPRLDRLVSKLDMLSSKRKHQQTLCSNYQA